MARSRSRAPRRSRSADVVLATAETSLLDIVDNVLNQGVVLNGDLTIALAHVDLIYARLSLLLCAADRVLPTEDGDPVRRRHARRQRRAPDAPRHGVRTSRR